MKKLLLGILATSSLFGSLQAFAGTGQIGSSEVPKLDAAKLDQAILNAAVRCHIAGLSLQECDANTTETSQRAITAEIARAEKLEGNMLYFLTTSTNPEVVKAVQEYAQSIFVQGKPIRETIESVGGALPKTDKTRLITNWNSCQVVSVSPNDCQ